MKGLAISATMAGLPDRSATAATRPSVVPTGFWGFSLPVSRFDNPADLPATCVLSHSAAWHHPTCRGVVDARRLEIGFRQTNRGHKLINRIGEAREDGAGMVINPVAAALLRSHC
jgi:hypothetical protein